LNEEKKKGHLPPSATVKGEQCVGPFKTPGIKRTNGSKKAKSLQNSIVQAAGREGGGGKKENEKSYGTVHYLPRTAYLKAGEIRKVQWKRGVKTARTVKRGRGKKRGVSYVLVLVKKIVVWKSNAAGGSPKGRTAGKGKATGQLLKKKKKKNPKTPSPGRQSSP